MIDDVQEQRDIATMLLTKLGYSVNAVPSGEAATEYMKTKSADLLILDMIMDPGIDGLQRTRISSNCIRDKGRLSIVASPRQTALKEHTNWGQVNMCERPIP